MDNLRIKKRRCAWSHDKTLMLFDIWRQYFSQLKGSRKNLHIYKDMSTEFKKKGINVCPEEIRIKINNLTQRYRDEKKKLDSGVIPCEWGLYKNVHDIMRNYYGCGDPSMVDESMYFDDSVSSTPSTSTSVPLKHDCKADLDISRNRITSPAVINGPTDNFTEGANNMLAENTSGYDKEGIKNKKYTKLQNEILEEIKSSNKAIINELAEGRKLTKELIDIEKQFAFETLRFQEKLLNILENKN